jgi:hypothetical protein
MRGQGDPVVHVGEEAAGRPRWQASGDGTKRESGDETESGRGGDETPRHIAADTTMQGGRRTRVHPCGARW